MRKWKHVDKRSERTRWRWWWGGSDGWMERGGKRQREEEERILHKQMKECREMEWVRIELTWGQGVEKKGGRKKKRRIK